MATDLSDSFIEQYVNINTKLKKRFMRKPNVSEATNEFLALAIQCEHSEQPAFAGQTYIGAAKCEASAGNIFGEVEHYIAAARQFMKAEKKLYSLKFNSSDRENLEAAIGCYIQALSKYPEKSTLRVSILLEMASELVDLSHRLEAAGYYEQALDIISDKTMKLMCLKNLMNLYIDCGKYEESLQTANMICDSKFDIPKGILSELQVSRVLLGLIVEAVEDNKPDSLKQLFDNLLNDEDQSLPFNTDLKLKLQSIVISSSVMDQQSLINISMDAKQHFTPQQIKLLEILIENKSQ